MSACYRICPAVWMTGGIHWEGATAASVSQERSTTVALSRSWLHGGSFALASMASGVGGLRLYDDMTNGAIPLHAVYGGTGLSEYRGC